MNDTEIQHEAERLYDKLKIRNWSLYDCQLIAPWTLEINKLKKEKNAIILAHSYQTPDIVFGVADYVGDSLGLSRKAASTKADIILFSGVVFMAETAKILSPDKVVLVPSIEAGCSLADSITAADVRRLREEHPGVPVVAYVNSTAEVKAEVDVCVTSGNLIPIINHIESDEIIFLPDQNMANYIREKTNKKVIDYKGTCIVHNDFNPNHIKSARSQFTDLVVIAHSECPPDVLKSVDIIDGTSGMERYIREHPDKKRYFLVTECGLSDRLAIEFPDREFYGTCLLCPYMKKNHLQNILQALKDPIPEQIIEIPEEIRLKARKSIDKMLEF